MRHPALRVMAGISLLTATLTLASCTHDPAATAAAEPLLEDGLPIGLITCEPQPGAVASEIVGPAGGRLQAGRHTLDIPAGALAEPVLITAEAPGDPLSTVRLSPEGLTFLQPATLTLDYTHCPASGLHQVKRIAYTSDALDILSYLESRDDVARMRVSAELDHFSRYAVSW